MPTFSQVIYKRRSMGVNSIILVVGKRGIGKSYASLFLCSVFDPDFSINQVVFSVEAFLDAMKDLKKGSCILFDESGISISARSFMSNTNQIMSFVGESFRFKGVDLITTVPSPNFIDTNIRQLSDFLIRMTGRGKGRVYQVSSNVFKSGDIKTPILCDIRTRKPDDGLCEQYESKRAAYLGGQYDNWLASLKEDRIRTQPKVKVYERAQEVIARLQSDGVPKTKLAYGLANELDISLSRSYQLLARILV